MRATAGSAHEPSGSTCRRCMAGQRAGLPLRGGL